MGKHGDFKDFAIIFTCMMAGFIFAIILQYMYTDNILLNVVVSTDVPLRVIQLVVIFLFTLIGVIIDAFNR